MDKPGIAFEVHNLETGKTYRIFDDGTTEGFGPGKLMVANNIPRIKRAATLNGLSLRENVTR